MPNFATMNTKKNKSNSSKPQLNKQFEPTRQRKTKGGGVWQENLGKYLIDISKFVVTGVVIASLFQDVTDQTLVYALGVVIAVSTLITGLILTNKKKEEN